MNNQAIIENLLDMWLSSAQLEAIKKGWNAFYKIHLPIRELLLLLW